LGGFVAPIVLARLRSPDGGYTWGIVAMVGGLLVAAALAVRTKE